MIPIPYLRLGAAIVALVALLWVGVYVRHVYRQAERVPELEQALVERDALIEMERKQAKERDRQEHELRKRMADVDARADKLARRLRHYYATLPDAADPSGNPFGTSGERVDPSEVDAAFGAVLAACQRDAIRLNGWRAWYEGVTK